MNQMKAIGFSEPGGPEVLKLVDLPRPKPSWGEHLVKVAACGVNRPDILQRRGAYPPPKGAPSTLGLELAGEIVESGGETRRFKVGDKVTALVQGGAYAEYAVVAEDNALPIPHEFPVVSAAALPETYFTVWTNVFQRGQLKAGETLLVHGGSSGIGTTAIQLAKAFGAKVIATAGSDEKCAACQVLGADLTINYRTSDFVEVMKSKDLKADVILDMVGGDYVPRNIEVAALNGRIVQIAFQQASTITADFMPLMLKRLTFTGSTLRPRTVAEKAVIARELEARVWPLLLRGQCKPQIYRTFPLAEAAQAHALMESSSHVGKIVLTL
jgi:NADPH2:quinone reductase